LHEFLRNDENVDLETIIFEAEMLIFSNSIDATLSTRYWKWYSKLKVIHKALNH